MRRVALKQCEEWHSSGTLARVRVSAGHGQETAHKTHEILAGYPVAFEVEGAG